MASSQACPACGAPLTVAPSVSGGRLHCPNCRRVLRARPRTPPAKPDAETTPDTARAPRKTKKTEPADRKDDQASIPLQRPSGLDEPLGTLDHIDRFEIRAVLGQGGFGRVYRAYDPVLDREVALKVPRLGARQAQHLERFLREARAAAGLRHRNIVSLYECGLLGDDMFLVCEYVAGTSLAARIAEHRPGPRRAASWVRDLARALAFAHARGVVHRDVKPGNVLIDGEGRPRLMDFGLAKRGQGGDPAFAGPTPAPLDLALTAEGSVIGTPAYMSPEQARGEVAAVGGQSDVYSLGVVLYELLTGKVPYRGSVHEVLLRIGDASVRPTPPRRLNAAVPVELEAICLKAMAKDAADRYAGAAELADDLNRWLHHDPILALPDSQRPKARRWLQKKRRWLVGAGLVVGLLLAGVVLVVRNARYQEGIRQAQREELTRIKQEQERLLRITFDSCQRRGLDLYRQKQFREGALLLDKAFQAAVDLEDEELQQSAGQNLRQWIEQAEPVPGIDPGVCDLWGQAVCRLLRAAPVSRQREKVAVAPGNNERATQQQALRTRQKTITVRLLGVALDDKEPATFAAFLPDGQTILSAGRASWRLWEVGSGKPSGPNQRHVPRAFTPDGAQVLTASGSLPTFVLRDTATGNERGRPFVCPSADEDVHLSPSGGTAVLTARGLASLWDTGTGHQLPSPEGKDWRLTGLTYSADGNRLLASWGKGKAREVKLWQGDQGHWFGCPPEFRLHHDGTDVRAMSLSPPNGKILLTVGQDGQVWLWKHEAQMVARLGKPFGEPGVRFEPYGRAIIPDAKNAGPAFVLFSPNGRQVVTGAGNKVQLWDTTTTRALGAPLIHPAVQGALVHSDGESLLTWSSDEVRLWRQASKLPIHPDAPVTWAGMSQDGQTIAVLAGGQVRLWPATVDAAKRIEAVHLWVELSTGIRADSGERFETLDAAVRQEHQHRFEELIGLSRQESAALPAN